MLAPPLDAQVHQSLQNLRDLTVKVTPGDLRALEFAQRLSLPVPDARLSEVGNHLRWHEFRRMGDATPPIAILAAHALQSELRPFETVVGLGRRQLDESSHDEWHARHRLAQSLLAAATTASGRSLDAQRMLARLAPYLVDEIERFVRISPRWVPACHFLDRALRVQYRGVAKPHPAIVRVASRTVTERIHDRWLLLERIKLRPPRSVAVLRLARRVGHEVAEPVVRRDVVELFLDAIRDVDLPVRGRRFALWVAAENCAALPEGAQTADRLSDTIEQCRSDPDLADVAAVLRNYGGGYSTWGVANPNWTDFFKVDHDNNGSFEWPCTSAVHTHLAKFVLPSPWSDSEMFASPWDRLPRQLVFAARRMTLEMLLHPSLVRAKAASDTLSAGGPVVATAVSRTLSLMLDHAESKVLPDHLVEFAANTMSYVGGDDSPLSTLIEVTRSDRSDDCRAAAIASLGDVLYRMRREDPEKPRRNHATAMDTLVSSLDSSSPAIVNAAIFAFQGLPSSAVSGKLHWLSREHSSPLTRDLALWCLEEASA
ncbi:MAG: hypothetical protein ABL953_14435 [Ilumatobacteraceae bacterium]